MVHPLDGVGLGVGAVIVTGVLTETAAVGLAALAFALLPTQGFDVTGTGAPTPGRQESGRADLAASQDPGTTQIITVTAPKYSTTRATLRAWELVNGQWRVVIGPWTARIGSSGFSTLGIGRRRQNSGTTPVGTYSISQGFGLRSDPGTKLPWTRITRTHWWPFDSRDPKTYNLLQDRRTKNSRWRKAPGRSEHLVDYRHQYSYAAVINFNVPSSWRRVGGQWVTDQPVDTSAGGGIFLHTSGPSSTAGCVSISGRRMRSLLRWLSPERHPQITMGPAPIVRSLTPFPD